MIINATVTVAAGWGGVHPDHRVRSGDGPLSARGRPSTVKGALRFLRKWPLATLDRGASAPPPVSDQGQARACPDRTRAIPSKVRTVRGSCPACSQQCSQGARRLRTQMYRHGRPDQHADHLACGPPPTCKRQVCRGAIPERWHGSLAGGTL